MVSGSLEDLKSKKFYVALLAEFLGTELLVLVACGSCVTYTDKPNVVQIALAFGLSVATMVWGIANVSGGHINPAVTIAMLVTRKISIVRALLYVVVQLLGATVGAAILMATAPKSSALGMTAINANLNSAQGFAIEFLITFVLVFTVFASCDIKRTDLNGSAPLAIGLSVAMCHLWAVPATGASMNTARSFGPAVVTSNWDNHWVYWVGPILGGVVAGFVYDNLFAANASPIKTKGCFTTLDYDGDDYSDATVTPKPATTNGDKTELAPV